MTENRTNDVEHRLKETQGHRIKNRKVGERKEEGNEGRKEERKEKEMK